MTGFVRFPHTPHLAWLGPGTPRADKVLDCEGGRAFLSGEVVVEEKVDGANLGLSISADGAVRAQNRGAYLELAALGEQWTPLRHWLAARRKAFEAATLAQDVILFGEWCYAVHSVRYTRLPDWFLAFDVYERSSGKFWSVERRDALARRLGIAVVPEVARGHFDLDELKKRLGRSALTDGPAEGLYLRREQNGFLLQRAKLVRAEFVQNIDKHWSARRLETNQLEGTAS